MKWVVLAILAIVLLIWLVRGKMQSRLDDPEIKVLDQQRYYVNPPKEGDDPPDDKQSTSL